MPDELIIDRWASLTYKPAYDRSTSRPWRPPSWLGEEHERRLRAYTLLSSYVENVARVWLAGVEPDKKQVERREYGDAELVVETVVDALLGETVTLAVTGEAEERRATEVQEWLDAWADAERPVLSLIEGETDSVALGDGVYVLGWDAARDRPTITVYDPGFYFPVLDDSQVNEYPDRIHIAWEYEDVEKDRYVRRITWELVTLESERELPYQESPSNVTCLLTDATWKLGNVTANGSGGTRVDDLDRSRATFAVNADGEELDRLDLDVDFIPVVHVPNTVSRKQHYGKSSLARILQVIDDLQAADTDLALASRTTGTPPLAVEGTVEKTTVTYGPGTVLGGKVTVVDTSKSLDALTAYVKFLLQRLSVNARVPEGLIGRVGGQEFPSGYALSLSFTALTAMVRRMRLVREEKWPLILKFALRLAAQAGQLPPGPLPAATFEPGRFLPVDRAQTIELVAKLVDAKLMSRAAGIDYLVRELGLTVEDVDVELTAIASTDFEGAKELADAVEDATAAAEYLGVELDERPPEPPPPPPVPTLPEV